MNMLKKVTVLICLFFSLSMFTHAYDFLHKNNYKTIPRFRLNLDKPKSVINSRPSKKRSTTFRSKSDVDESVEYVNINHSKKTDRYIGCKGITITLDENLLIGAIVYTAKGVFVYDRAGNLIACILYDSEIGYAFIGEMPIIFDKNCSVRLNSDDHGRLHSVSVNTAVGSYLIQKTKDGEIEITSPKGAIAKYDIEQYDLAWITINYAGSMCLWLVSTEQGTVTKIEFDSETFSKNISADF